MSISGGGGGGCSAAVAGGRFCWGGSKRHVVLPIHAHVVADEHARDERRGGVAEGLHDAAHECPKAGLLTVCVEGEEIDDDVQIVDPNVSAE